jgi:hypothetical protein
VSEPGWVALDAELDRWTKGGMVATLWWRDDDAVAPSAELDRLLAIGGATIPIALAVIPAEATESLAARLSGMPRIFVLQHGYAHRNHRGAGERAAEFGGDRPQSVERDELERGLRRLALLFGDRLVPVFVPPWNRFDESLVATLQALGFTGLSSFGPRQSAGAGGMVRVNAHVDPIAWRRDRAFLGEEETLARLVRHLAARRTGQVDAAEPTGLLTHHRVHAPDLWNFLGRLADRIARHDSARWLRPDEIFAR